MIPKKSVRNRGGAMVLAVAVLGLVAAAIVAMTSIATSEFHRTRTDVNASRTEQYQLAAIVIAHDQLNSGRTTDGPLTVPEWAPSAVCRWLKVDPSHAVAHIKIEHTARRLEFILTAGTWTLTSSQVADPAK